MSKLLSISEAAKVLGVSESTLRRWEHEGQLLPDERTKGGQIFVLKSLIIQLLSAKRLLMLAFQVTTKKRIWSVRSKY